MVFPAFSSSPPSTGGIPDPVVTPSTWADDIPIYLGDDQEGGLVNDDANGNGRALYWGDLTYSDPVTFVRIVEDLAEVYAQRIGGSSSFRVRSEGIIEAYFAGQYPSFNVHDNLAVINPFNPPNDVSGVQSATAGTLSAGDYEYAVVLVTAAGSTTPSANSTPVTVDGSHKAAVTLAALPVGGVSWSLYRTVVDDPGGDVLLVEADLAAGVYQDDLDDGSLGDPPPAVNDAGGNLTVDGEIRISDGQSVMLGTVGRLRPDLDNLGGVWIDLFSGNDYFLLSSDSGAGVTMGYGLFGSGSYVTAFNLAATDITLVGSGDGTRKLILGPSVTGRSSLNIPAGTAPTSPSDEDIWTDGDNMFIRINGATYKFVLEAA